MSGVGSSNGLSRAIDILSSSLFAGGVGYSVLALSHSEAGAAAAAAGAFVAAKLLLSRIIESPTYSLTPFDIDRFEARAGDDYPELLLTDLAELLLTDNLVVEPDELLLVDQLEVPANDSRVIRLFDPRSLPTAGELHERIDRHLGRSDRSANADATAELHEALAALRGSLR